MARTLSEIYAEIKERKNANLALKEVENPSQMSIMDSMMWVFAAGAWTLETLWDVFQVDMAESMAEGRINGTPAYYVSALLKYQHGDSLQMNDDGTQFSYATVDENKRVITHASYREFTEDGFYDKRIELRAVKGQPGEYEPLTLDELTQANAYIQQIAFAGTNVLVVSKKGDILVPRLTIYYDGMVSEDEMYAILEEALNNFTASIPYSGKLYESKLIAALAGAKHVTDVYNRDMSYEDGVFVISFDDDGNPIPLYDIDNEPLDYYEYKVDRVFDLESGFLRESTGEGGEEFFPKWRETIQLIVEQR